LQRFEDTLLALVAEATSAGPCAVAMETGWTVSPVPMSQAFQYALSRAAEKHAPGGFISMPSGARHDAQILARKLPAGRCQVLADAAEEIALSA
jgi:N-carbamoyl-L-amino-acid hydrolase